MIALLLFLLLCGPLWAAPIDGYPDDPKGGRVSDRLFERVTVKNKEFCLYAVVWRAGGGKPDQVIIYTGKEGQKGMDWKKLYTWVLKNENMTGIPERAVLKCAGNDSDIQFWFQEWFAYQEGRAHAVLRYTPSTGKFNLEFPD